MKGTVLAGSNNLFTLECEDGIERNCTIKGKVLKASKDFYNPLAPGDVVEFDPDELDNKKGQILDLVDRKNTFLRWNVKGRCPQLLASNLDFLVLVTTPDCPPFRPRFIDRALAQAEHQGITPVIVCNKYDLAEEMQKEGDPLFEDIERRLSIWEDLGYKVLRISAKTGEGMTDFAEFLENKTCAFVGQSGVGKSSLVNVFFDTWFLKTGSLSKKYGRGAHTTTKGTLLRLQLNETLTGGIKGKVASIVDTPGIRRFVLDDVEPCDVAFYFREIAPYIGKCEFGMSCRHDTEPGCAVKEALENGDITEERFDSWDRIRYELETGKWAD